MVESDQLGCWRGYILTRGANSKEQLWTCDSHSDLEYVWDVTRIEAQRRMEIN